MPADLVRDAAVDVLLRVFERGVYLDESLDRTLRRRAGIAPRGRRFMTQLVYGTVRHRLLCEHVVRGLLHQSLESLPPAIRVILCMGVFQSLFCSQVTPPAMVHTSVELAKKRGHAGTARLVNAVLRRAPRSLGEVRLPPAGEHRAEWLSLRYSMPRWLVERWLDEHGAEAEALIESCNRTAATTVRVNTLKGTRDEVRRYLAKAELPAEHLTKIPEELTVEDTGNLLRSKWFQRGYFTCQDPASMLAGHLVEPQPGEKVLDLCAAPGGKSTHMAQIMGGGGLVVAMDVSLGKLAPLRENVERLELPQVRLLCADGVHAPFCGGFDRVLVDAPCSGLGTIRRHPDLKLRLAPDMFARLAALQLDLLRAGVALCKNGGLIVYSVCTISREETRDVVKNILGEGAVSLEDGPEWFQEWRIGTGQYQTLPHRAGLDGFFLTRFRKRS